jgi:hypothetical protein
VHTVTTLKLRARSTRFTSAKSIQLSQVLKTVETERANLSRTESLLGCLAIAMEYGEMGHRGPYYPDVALIARQMLKSSINALDPINLPSPPRDKVKEKFFAKECAPAATTLEVALSQRSEFFLRHRYSMRLHRRNYSRTLAREASSRNSASANISG